MKLVRKLVTLGIGNGTDSRSFNTGTLRDEVWILVCKLLSVRAMAHDVQETKSLIIIFSVVISHVQEA